MPKEIKGYKCDYCHRCFGRKVNAIQHEQSCKNSPTSRHCRTCVHGVWAVIGGHEYEEWGAFCDYHNKPIHEKPYFFDCDFRDDYFGRTDLDQPIPGTCYYYEYKGKPEWTGFQEYIDKQMKGNEALYAYLNKCPF